MRATDLPLGHTVRLSTMMRFAVRACVGVALCAGSATAQLREVQAYQAVVTTATPMRSGDSQRFYSVLDLKSGDVVTVDAESAEWARIAYPPGGSAFIRADQAELGPTGQSVKLKVESKLLSVNPEHGLSGSWKSLLPDAAKPGAEFKLIDVIKEKDAVLGYRIAAPAEARGFVLARALRRATQAEIDAAKTLSAGTLPPATSAPAPRNTAAPAGSTTAREVPATMPTMGPNGQPAMTTSISVAPEERAATSTPPATSSNSAASTTPGSTPAASTPNTATPAAAIPPTATPPAATGTPAASIDLTRPQQPAGQTPPASTESSNPAVSSTTEITQSTSGAATASAAGESAPAPAAGVNTDGTADTSRSTEPQADATSAGEMEVARPPLPSTAEDLEPLFQAVRRQDVMNAEIDELLTQYETLIARRPVGDRRRRVLEQRAEILRLMQDYRNERRTLEEANAAARAVTDDMSRRFAQYDVQRQYAIVGVLTPSSVYDGTRLPLMYRLQSIGGSVPRTLGYIKPREDLNLPSKIGVVVGVVGEQNVDSSLRLNVIDPVRVDPLRAAENPVRVQP